MFIINLNTKNYYTFILMLIVLYLCIFFLYAFDFMSILNISPVGYASESTFDIESAEVVDISAGRWHSLALDEEGQVYSFGLGSNGRLGLGDNTDQHAPTPIPALDDAVSISAGGSHSLVLTAAGEVYAFGRGSQGQLGTGRARDENEPVPLVTSEDSSHSELPPEQAVRDISAGGEHSLILLENGDVYAFGFNRHGQLGLGIDEDGDSWEFYPRRVDISASVAHISAGYAHSLAITVEGEVYAFGRNDDGQLGLGHTSDTPAPQSVELSSEDSITDISAGHKHSLFIAGGEAYSCGYGIYGRLGHGDTARRRQPEKILRQDSNPDSQLPVDIPVAEISAGGQHSIMQLTDGRVFSFGRNRNGQLGLGHTRQKNSPQELSPEDHGGTLPAPAEATALSAGRYHSMVLTSGKLYAFGQGGYGRLGLGKESSQKDPALVVSRPLLNSSPANILYTNAGYEAFISVSASGFAPAKWKFRWEYSANGGREWKAVKSEPNFNIENTKLTSTLHLKSVKPERDGYLYRCVVVNTAGNEEVEAVSSTITKRVDYPLIFGDLSGDGKVEILDGYLALRYLTGLHELDDQALASADVTGTGEVTISDAVYIMRRVIGQNQVFPVEK